MDHRARLKEVAATWHPPGELERSRPRELCLTAAGIAVVILAVVLGTGALASGVLLYVKAASDHQTRQRVMETGQDAVAQAVRRSWSRSGSERRYWIEYKYTAGGQVYTGRVQVGRRAWEALDAGARIPVRYIPSDPAQHIVVEHAGELMPLWVPYLVAGGMAFGAWLIVRRLVSQRHLLAEGRAAPGIITRHEKKRGTERKHGTVAHYMFRLLSGSVAEGKTGPHKRPPAVDAVVCVLYLPDRERRNAIYPLSLVRTAYLLRTSGRK